MKLQYPDPALVDQAVALRAWQADDLDCVREVARDPRITAVTTVPSVFTPERGLAFIERQQQRIACGEGIALAIVQRSSGRAVGHMWLAVRPQPAVLGIGYWLIPSARRQGLARRAVGLTSRWALRDLAAARIEAWVDPGNEPSLRTLAGAGFVKEGLLRSFLENDSTRVDVLVLSLVPSDLSRS